MYVFHNFTLEEHSIFEICDVCNWKNDDVALKYPNELCGPNTMSLNEARKAWAEGKPVL